MVLRSGPPTSFAPLAAKHRCTHRPSSRLPRFTLLLFKTDKNREEVEDASKMGDTMTSYCKHNVESR